MSYPPFARCTFRSRSPLRATGVQREPGDTGSTPLHHRSARPQTATRRARIRRSKPPPRAAARPAYRSCGCRPRCSSRPPPGTRPTLWDRPPSEDAIRARPADRGGSRPQRPRRLRCRPPRNPRRTSTHRARPSAQSVPSRLRFHAGTLDPLGRGAPGSGGGRLVATAGAAARREHQEREKPVRRRAVWRAPHGA